MNDTLINDKMNNCTRLSLVECVRILGEGDVDKGLILLRMITDRLRHGRKTHPIYANSAKEAIVDIKEEFDELYYALEHESKERQIDEALDLLITSLRFVAEEYVHD